MNTSIHNFLTPSLREEWKKLWGKSPYANMANSPEWFEAALDVFNCKEIRIIVVRNSKTGELAALLPLVRARLYGLKVFTAPAAEFADHASILADLGEEEIAREISHAIQSLGPVSVPGLYESEALALLSWNKKIASFPTDEEFFMDFSEGSYGKINMKKIRISLNRIKKSPQKIDFRLASEDIKKEMDKCFEVDKVSVKHEMGKGVFWRSEARKFYLRLAELLPNYFHIPVLSFDGLPAAYWIFFGRGGRYTASQKAYLSGYEYYNTGFVSFIKFLDEINKGSENVVSLGRGRDRFKTDFADDSQTLYTAIASKNIAARYFLLTLLWGRECLYKLAVKSPKIYRNFKRLKNIFSSHE